MKILLVSLGVSLGISSIKVFSVFAVIDLTVYLYLFQQPLVVFVYCLIKHIIESQINREGV